MRYLSDGELIDYTIKHDTDEVRVRLATIMERMPGAIMDGLLDAGMDDTWCTFENTYHPGEYIRHLQNEVEFLNNELHDALEKLREREALTVSNLIEELLHENRRLDIKAQQNEGARIKAEEDNERTQKKMKVWTALSTDLTNK